jgi:cytochrome c
MKALITGVLLMTVPAVSQSANTTIWTRVYTSGQSERGQKAYDAACSSCHRDDLSGSDDGAPAMRGPVFFERWKNRPLSELHFVLTETMPQDAPGSLTAQQYTDIISFLLNRNGVPAGETELPADTASLKRILVVDPPR